jgi:hypothetical protein
MQKRWALQIPAGTIPFGSPSRATVEPQPFYEVDRSVPVGGGIAPGSSSTQLARPNPRGGLFLIARHRLRRGRAEILEFLRCRDALCQPPVNRRLKGRSSAVSE